MIKISFRASKAYDAVKGACNASNKYEIEAAFAIPESLSSGLVFYSRISVSSLKLGGNG